MKKWKTRECSKMTKSEEKREKIEMREIRKETLNEICKILTETKQRIYAKRVMARRFE